METGNEKIDAVIKTTNATFGCNGPICRVYGGIHWLMDFPAGSYFKQA